MGGEVLNVALNVSGGMLFSLLGQENILGKEYGLN